MNYTIMITYFLIKDIVMN